jgi:hypothetical protein
MPESFGVEKLAKFKPYMLDMQAVKSISKFWTPLSPRRGRQRIPTHLQRFGEHPLGADRFEAAQ